MVTGWGFAWRTASRFVAGEKLEDAINVVKEMNAKGINVTLDHLGEHTNDEEKAVQATEDIIAALTAIEENAVRSNVSIKLTQIGLALDEELCARNLQRLLAYSEERGTFVRIDMEDSPWVEQTLRLYHRLHDECGCENLGVVIQSYLYRSEGDVEKLMAEGARVRLCKGAYKEPAEIAYPKKSDVDANYDHLAEMLIEGALSNGRPAISDNGKVPPIPAIATHDEARIDHAKAYAEKAGLAKTAIEFQFLYGIGRELQQQLAAQGYPVRVYVPYGTEWYPYFTRRLAERPANLWFFLSSLLRG